MMSVSWYFLVWMMFVSLQTARLALQSVISTYNKSSRQNVNMCKHDAYQPVGENLLFTVGRI